MASPRSLGRKLGIALGVVVALVVLLVVLVLVVVQSGVATKRAVDLVLPGVSKALGREVTLKDASLKIFPNPRVTLAGLAVAGRPGEPGLVEMESLDVSVGLWPLLRSLGKDVEVQAFTLVRPTVNLVKAKDGTWNFEGLGAPPAGAPPAGKPAPEPAPAPEGGATRVAVSQVSVQQAAIRVIDRTTGRDDAGLALTQLDFEAHGVGPGLPFDARLAAALADTKQNLQMQLSVARLPEGIPQRPEDWPEVQGRVTLRPLVLDRIRALFPGDVGAIVRGGTASVDAKLSTVPAPRGYRVDGTGELKDVRLRGQASSGHFRAAEAWSPAKPAATRLDLTDVALRGPGVDLGGNLSVETAPMRAWFVLTGPLLDLDAVMGLLPPEEAKAPAKPAAPAAGGELVPEATRRQLQAASAHGTIAIEMLKAGRIEVTGMKAQATLSRGTLALEQMDAQVFGGRVSAGGTTVSIAEPEPTWKLAAKLSGLDLEKTIAAFADGRSPLLGKLDGTLDVAGKGTVWEKMRQGLDGLTSLKVNDGALTTTDLGGQVLGGVAKGLAALGKGSAAQKVGGAAGGKTTFKDLAGSFKIKDGFLAAQSPLKFGSGAGAVSLGGRIGLDGRLDLQGTTLVPKKVLAGVISGVPLPESLEVPLGLGGTLSSPSVSVRADQAAGTLVKGAAGAAAKQLQDQAKERGGKALKGLFDRFGK